jgi:hypothetical protein
MATFNATKGFGSPLAIAGIGDGQSPKVMVSSYSLAAALALNDVIQSPPLPKGAVVYDVMLAVTDLDTNGAPTITLDVGYGGDPDYFIAASTVGQTGGVARAAAVTAAVPLALTVNDTIDVLVKAGPATGATTGTVTLVVHYVMQTS